jgi:hypothetical protein
MKAFLLSTGYLHELKKLLSGANTKDELYSTIVNAPFSTHLKGQPLGLSIVVFLLVNKKRKTIQRIALSDTEAAKGALEYSVKKFHEIEIPLNDKNNTIVQVVKNSNPETVTDWEFLFTPALTAEEARFNQAGAGIATSVVYPLNNVSDGGAIIFSYVLPSANITKQYHNFMHKYVELVGKALSRQSNRTQVL